MPDEVAVEVKDGTSLFAAAIEADVELESQCGGRCGCALCRVKLLEGLDSVSPMEWEEQAHLGSVFHVTHERLACQTRVLGDVVVEIPEAVERVKKAYVPHAYKKNAQAALLARIQAQESEVDSQRTVKGKQRRRRRRKGPTPSSQQLAAASGEQPAAGGGDEGRARSRPRPRPDGGRPDGGRPGGGQPAGDKAAAPPDGERKRPRRRRRRRRRKPRGGGGGGGGQPGGGSSGTSSGS